MPRYFCWTDKEFNSEGKVAVKSLLAESEDKQLQHWYKRILNNGEKILGSGKSSVVFELSKNSVCYITTDEHKFDYLQFYLGVADYPYREIDITYKEKQKKLYLFRADRLFSFRELTPKLKLYWKEKLDTLTLVTKDIAKTEKISLTHNLELFDELCRQLIKKDRMTWLYGLETLSRWVHEKGKNYGKLYLDLLPDNFLYNDMGNIIYIIDPATKIGSSEMLTQLRASTITREQLDKIIDLATDEIAYNYKNFNLKQFRQKVKQILA
jgi:hypothetical protein